MRRLTCLVWMALGAAACSPTALPPMATPSATAPGLPPATPQVRRVTPQQATETPPLPSATPSSGSPQPSPTATPTLGPGQQISPIDGARVQRVPAGDSWMGSADSELLTEPDELPQHRVRLQAFWIDQTEVTNRQYALCVSAGACDPPPAELELGDEQAYYAAQEFAAYPVTNVSWVQAKAYCQWTGRRLPSEAEWERAARGRDARIYPWGWFGLVMDDRLNFCDQECPYPWRDARLSDGHARTAPVGSYPRGASPYGALDMAGNVWEWVSDWYDSAAYSPELAEQPAGPEQGRYKVVRGGSWLDGTLGDYMAFARAANRHWQPPNARQSYIGFRCAASAQDLN